MDGEEKVSYFTQKDGQHLCPQCLKPMPYVKLSERLQKWSPRAHGWQCAPCNVHIHDGDLDPKGARWERRHKQKKRTSMFAAVAKFGFNTSVTPYELRDKEEEIDKKVDELADRALEEIQRAERRQQENSVSDTVSEADLRNLEKYLESAEVEE